MDLPNDFNRRRLLQGAGVAAVAGAPVLLAACGDEGGSSSGTDEANDLKIVEAGFAREQEMAARYTSLLKVAPSDAKPLVQEILTREQAHVTGLATVISDLGGKAGRGPGADPAAIQLQGQNTWRASLGLTIQQEREMVGGYIGEVSRLTIGDLRATWTSLATSASQYITVLETLPR